MEILLDNKLSTAMENFGLKIEHIERKCIIIEYDRYTTRRDINLLQHRLDDSTKNIEARQPIINKAGPLTSSTFEPITSMGEDNTSRG